MEHVLFEEVCKFLQEACLKKRDKMIRENQRFFNAFLVITDMTIITFSLIFAWYLRFETDLLGFGYSIWKLKYYSILILILPIYIFLYYSFGLYNPKRTENFDLELKQILKVNVIGLLAVITLLYLINIQNYSRYLLALFALFSTVFSISERFVLRELLRFMRSKGRNVRYILVVGAGELGEKFASKIRENSYIGYHIIGFLDDNLEVGHKILDSEVIGTIGDLEKVIMTNIVDKVILTVSSRHYEVIENIVDKVEKHGVKAEIVPDYYRYFPAKPCLEIVDDIPVINIRYVPLDNYFNKTLKRFVDIILALVGIIITSPILIITAVMVKITSPGPVIFKQNRVGLNKKLFSIYKFRSMKVQDKEQEKYSWSTRKDPRKTRVGSFIRKTNIDELPQFFNILKGDMSLIGPRPERPYFVEKFRDEIPKYMVKHYVRPGMTGWAQVNGWRGNTSIAERVRYDIYYVENWSFLFDVKIFFMTFLNAFKNAY